VRGTISGLCSANQPRPFSHPTSYDTMDPEVAVGGVITSRRGDALAEHGDVRNQADGPVLRAQTLECANHRLQQVLVERAEPLVEEEELERGTPELDRVGKRQSQCERDEERLAAGERRR